MAQPDPPMQSFFRLCIMLGTAVVLGMAAYVYGPPPEQVGPMLDRVMAYAKQIGERMTDTPPADEPVGAPPAVVGAPPLAPPAELSENQLAAWPAAPVPVEPNLVEPNLVEPSLINDPALRPLLNEVRSAGARSLELTPWGDGGQLYRCCCTAPAAPGSPFARHLNVVAADPASAVRGVAAQLRGGGALANAH